MHVCNDEKIMKTAFNDVNFYRLQKCILTLILFSSFMNIPNGNAYLIGKLNSSESSNTQLSFDRPVHVVIAGDAHEAGMLFQQAALSRGLKYRESYPDDQVIFMAQQEKTIEYNAQWLIKRNVSLVEKIDKDLTTEKLVQYLKQFKKIRSLDIFSHSALKYGVQISSIISGKIGPEDKKFLELKANFTTDATITINGCNTGFRVAPAWSKAFGIPVSGSLTSTDFQEPHTNNQYYFNNEQSIPKDFPKKDFNDLTYSQAPNCKLGLCVRMKPISGPYNGFWGSYYEGALTFYKIFCNGVSEQQCKNAYKKIATNFISVKNLNLDLSFEAYKEVVQDMLCPISVRNNIRKECVNALTASESDKTLNQYSPIKTKALQCTDQGCLFDLDCPLFSKKCNLINLAKTKSTTLTEEYERYLKAF